MRNIFTEWLRPTNFTGVLGDGSEAESISYKEAIGIETAAAAAASLKLDEKGPGAWRCFLHQYQHTSGACVAFTLAKIAQVFFYAHTNRKIRFSPGWIYRRRKNFPAPGMHIDDVIKLAGRGMITEELYPSEGLTEAQINALKDEPYGAGVAEEFAIPTNWVNLPTTFDTIAASILKTQKGIMLWFDFGPGEWFNEAYPHIIGNDKRFRHSVTAVDAVRYKGSDYIVVEDSAERAGDTEFGYRKLVSRDFITNRCLLARYPLGFKFDPQGPSKPSYTGTTTSLQDCLTYEGLFPSNVTARGYYGTITIQAVQAFQKKYSIAFSGSPETNGFGKVGPKTRAKLIELYP